MRTEAAERPRITLADLGDRIFATVPETAALFRWDERTVRNAIRAGDIPAVKAGATWRIPVAWLRKAATGQVSVGNAA